MLRLSLDRPDAGWRAGDLTRYAAKVVAAGRAGPLPLPCNEPSQEHLQVAVLALVHRSVCAMAAAFAHIATALLSMAHTDRLSPTPNWTIGTMGWTCEIRAETHPVSASALCARLGEA